MVNGTLRSQKTIHKNLHIITPLFTVKMIKIRIALFALIISAASTRAQDPGDTARLLIHLDASVDTMVVTDAADVVTSWKDKSGNAYTAIPGDGDAIYPAAKTFDNGLNGIDFRGGHISMELLSAEDSDTILDQAANPTGFCIVAAVYVESVIENWNDLAGNTTTVNSDFMMRYSSTGNLQANLGPSKNNGSAAIQPGQPVIFSFNYDADNGVYTYWCSATEEEVMGQVQPADFSNGLPLTIGAMDGGGRYFEGMVGEVRIYNSDIPAAQHTEIIYEMGAKWGVDLPRIPQPPDTRIVETNWSDSDVAIIQYDATEAPYLADNTGATDATQAIQLALDDCGNAPGGVVYLPEGDYRIDGNLVLPDGVTLRGDWKKPTAKDKTIAGTVLHIYGSKGEDSDDVSIASPLKIGASGGIRDLTIFYPEQDATAPVPYPYTIRCEAKMQTVMNVTLVNAYKGIRFQRSNGLAVGHPNVHNVYGSPVKKGVLLNKAAAVPRLTSIDFDPAYWAESGLAGAPSEVAILSAQRSLSSIGLEFEQSDNGIAGALHIKGYDVAISIGAGGNPSNMKVYDFDITDCRTGINAVKYKSQGWTLTNGSIQVDGEGALAVNQPGQGMLTFNDVSFSSTGRLVNSATGSLGFTNCHFQDWNDDYAIYLSNGNLVAYGNTFSKTLEEGQLHIYLASTVNAAAVAGNTFENSAPKITSMNPDTNFIVIDTTGHYEVYRHDYPSHTSTDYFFPAKVDVNSLFNVRDFGAVADMLTDDTDAFKAALTAAEQYGGGTVYVPGGAYRINGNLEVPTGVELRGVHDVPIYTGHGRSILLSYLDMENPGEDAFITMQEGSGIRGLLIIRPQQVYNEADTSVGTVIYDWPYAIRAVGDNCSLVNIAIANADKGVDLASMGGGHHVNWYMTAPIRLCLNIQTGDQPITIDNMQTNPGLFRDIKGSLDWNLFTEDVALAIQFQENIAPKASESRDLYPSGTAVNIKGDGILTFYSNFYNNPFNGFVINGSPTMKSYLSGGEGEIFYTVESEGSGPIDLEIIANTYHPIESDPAITGFGSYQLNPGSDGVIKVLNTTSFGNPNVGYRINNGNLIVQSAYQTVSMQTYVEASGDATASLEGSFLRNGMSGLHAVARSTAADVSILGTYSENNYRVSTEMTVSGSTPRYVTRIDAENPSAPVNLHGEADSESEISLKWDPSTDNVGVAGYFVYRNGLYLATTSDTIYADAGLSVGTSYAYFVRAFDDASNLGISSDTISVETLGVPSDTIPPSAPDNLQAQAISASQIDLTWEASSDNVKVAGYNVYRDGVKVDESETLNYSDTGLTRETSYDYHVTAYDDAGNESVSSDTVAVSTLVSVGNLHYSDGGITVYPNPSDGKVFFDVQNSADAEFLIEFYAVDGTLTSSAVLHTKADQSEYPIDVSELDHGFYLYKIIGDRTNVTGRILISK